MAHGEESDGTWGGERWHMGRRAMAHGEESDGEEMIAHGEEENNST